MFLSAFHFEKNKYIYIIYINYTLINAKKSLKLFPNFERKKKKPKKNKT